MLLVNYRTGNHNRLGLGAYSAPLVGGQDQAPSLGLYSSNIYLGFALELPGAEFFYKGEACRLKTDLCYGMYYNSMKILYILQVLGVPGHPERVGFGLSRPGWEFRV